LTRSVEAREALRGRLIKHYENEPSALRANIARIENGPPVGYPIQYRVSGEDIPTLRRIAGEVADGMRGNNELSNVNFDWSELSKVGRDRDRPGQGAPAWRFRPGSRGTCSTCH
jgi:multidrug efflux pump